MRSPAIWLTTLLVSMGGATVAHAQVAAHAVAGALAGTREFHTVAFVGTGLEGSNYPTVDGSATGRGRADGTPCIRRASTS